MIKLRCRHEVESAVTYFTRDKSLSDAEKSGQWQGRGATLLGLQARPVNSQDLSAMLSGYSPEMDSLCSHRNANRRSSWEIVVAPDKSVSIAALCESSSSLLVREAHAEAVTSILSVVESLACRQNGSKAYVPTGNVVAALFTHEASRHGDPHLHSHLLIMNATRDPESRRWRSLEASPLYKTQGSLNALYNRELHRALKERGIVSALSPEGVASIPAVPQSARSRLSKAHRIIKRAAAAVLPLNLQGLNRRKAENRLNDRLRPAKSKLTSFQPAKALQSDERRHLEGRIRSNQPLPVFSRLLPDAGKQLKAAMRKVSFIVTDRSKLMALTAVAVKNLHCDLLSLLPLLRNLGSASPPSGVTSGQIIKTNIRHQFSTTWLGPRPFESSTPYSPILLSPDSPTIRAPI